MKPTVSLITLIGTMLTASVTYAQSPGSILGFAGQVNGSVTVASTAPGGCPTLVCTTNMVTYSHCYTNTYWKLVCTTNAAGAIQCTNVPVTVTRCFTNTFPQITCTNVFQTPTSLTIKETLAGALTENASCDQLSALFTSNGMFQASLSLSVRINDWVGTHMGIFKILDGTNVLAYGSLSGVDGVSTASGGTCAACNHLEGTLHGVVTSGPLQGAKLTASYAADLTGVTCPSSDVPAGAVMMTIQGVGVIPCPSRCFGFPGF